MDPIHVQLWDPNRFGHFSDYVDGDLSSKKSPSTLLTGVPCSPVGSCAYQQTCLCLPWPLDYWACRRLSGPLIKLRLFPHHAPTCFAYLLKPCRCQWYELSVKLHLRDGGTKRRVSASVRSFVRLSLSVVSVRAVHPMGRTNRELRCFIEI